MLSRFVVFLIKDPKSPRLINSLRFLRDSGLESAYDIGMSRPKVGVGVAVTSQRYPQQVLIGRRKNATGAGLWALPGGHLEFGESWEECGRREVMEETGLKLKDVSFQLAVNTINVPEKYHYVTIFLRGELDDAYKAEPENMEPDKCEGWKWLKWSEFPTPEQLFWSLRDARGEGFDPFKGK